jgi:hypothetical protein
MSWSISQFRHWLIRCGYVSAAKTSGSPRIGPSSRGFDLFVLFL